MSALSAPYVLDALRNAGMTVSLTPDMGVKVAPASNLTTDLRDLIRCNKAMLIDWLTAANDADVQAPVTPDDQIDWHELDAAYLAHHVNCKICIAAGRGIRYGLRCGTGVALWRAYSDAATQPTIKTKDAVMTRAKLVSELKQHRREATPEFIAAMSACLRPGESLGLDHPDTMETMQAERKPMDPSTGLVDSATVRSVQ